MHNKAEFYFWTMFSIPRLENWLQKQASEGKLLEDVRSRYFFTFKSGPGTKVAYCVDFRGYIPDGYLSHLDRNNWLRLKLDRNWQLLYREYDNKYPLLCSDYDEDMVAGLKRNISIAVAALVFTVLLFYLLIGENLQQSLVKVVLFVYVVVSVYNILRLFFYRIMLEERIKQNNP